MNSKAPGISVDFFEHLLSGKIFDQLQEANSVFSEDLFLLDRNGDQSKSVSYRALSSSVADRALAEFDIRTMAHKETWEYAKAGHDHDGQYVSVAVSALSPASGVCVAVISAGADVVPVYAPPVYFDDTPEPDVGTLKFVCSKSGFRRIDGAYIESPDFDGWVYPDGTTFYPSSPDRFEKAMAVYGNASGTGFSVPDIRCFVKAASAPVDGFDVKPQTLGVAPHRHRVSGISFSGELKPADGVSLSTYGGAQSSLPENKARVCAGNGAAAAVSDIGVQLDLGNAVMQLSC